MIKEKLFGADLPSEYDADALLDPAIQPAKETTDPYASASAVFLTGATGFTGAYVLSELLKRTKADIHCLVRSASPQQGLARIEAGLRQYDLWDDSHSSRIVAIPGSLARYCFDLSMQEFESLAGAIDAIYHVGASVKLVSPYLHLRTTNVYGTREILRLAAAVRNKPTHIVSTVSVFDFFKYKEGELVYEDDPPGNWRALRFGYEQSKCVAEMLVEGARSRDLKISIYRPGRICGDSRSGKYNLADTFSTFTNMNTTLQYAPQVRRLMDMTPVDYVAAALVEISLKKESLGRNYHLINSEPMLLHDLLSCVRSFGYPVEEISFQEWQARISNLPQETQREVMGELAHLFQSVSREEMESFPRFSINNTVEMLTGTDIKCPPVDEALLQTYFSYFIRSGFLKPPAEGRFIA